MSYSDYGSVTSDLPDRPLVVKCTFDRGMKRISFTAAHNCTYELLRTKVEQSFSLSATAFTIAYQDDDGEVTEITNDYDLSEAIQYFQAGGDIHSSSGMSIASGRSGSSRKITLRVRITVDYDGPSLSDTASLSSLDDFPRDRSSGQRSRPIGSWDGVSLSGYSDPLGLEDDAVTVSSRDHLAPSERRVVPSIAASSRSSASMPPNYRPPNHALPSIATSPPSPPLSDAPSAPTNLRRFGGDSVGSVSSRHDATPREFRHEPLPPLSPPPLPYRPSPSTSPQTTLVFERLKLSEERDRSTDSLPPSLTQSERNARWLQEQNDRVMRTMIGEVAESSSSDAASIFQEEEIVIPGEIQVDLALQKNPRGSYYYTYTSDPNDSSDLMSHRESSSFAEGPTSPIALSDVQHGFTRPKSHHLAWLANQQLPVAGSSRSPFEDPACMPNESGSSSFTQKFPPLDTSSRYVTDDPQNLHYGNIPAELLPFLSTPEATGLPSELTECSACLTPLDSFRYICATCGEKEPRPKGVDIPESSNSPGKGKGKAYSSDGYLSVEYPPVRGSPASPTSSSWTLLGDREHSLSSSLSTIGSFLKGKHKILRKSPSRTSIVTSRSGSSPKPSYGSSAASDTAFSPSPNSPTSPYHRSTATLVQPPQRGYELCSKCIYTAGVAHAQEGALATPSTPRTPSISNGSSPLSSPEERARPGWKSTSSLKGRVWHAFIEKVWSGTAWTAIEQGDKPSCTICNGPTAAGRYKCASCPQFDLCRGCYEAVDEIHPTHAFLAVPEQPVARPTRKSQDTGTQPVHQEEQSLKHPGVICHHCQLDIVGARFHCAICEAVDICQNCESAGLPGNLTTNTDGGHDASHVMIKIPYPLESTEVAFASRRARVLWSERDAATIEAINNRINPRSRTNSFDSSHAPTVVASSRRRTSLNPLDHFTPCNECHKNIVGPRFQCAHCPSAPSAYNLCGECEKLSFIIHPADHVFLKIKKRVDRPINSPMALLPTLYEESGETDEIESLASEDLQNLWHESTLCDRCMSKIRGPWFRCVYCSADMCDEHEQLHRQDHVCMVFKAKVNLRQLRLITDIDNPGDGAAVIHQVYNTS